MQVTTAQAKAIILLVLFVIGFVCVLIPRGFNKISEKYRDYLVSLGQAGSGGIFLAAAMVDMFPGGLEDFYELLPNNLNLAAQITSTVFISGFLLIFFIEKVLFIGYLEPRQPRVPTKTVLSINESDSFTNDLDKKILYEEKPLHSVPKPSYSTNSILSTHSHRGKKGNCTHDKFSFECLTDNEYDAQGRIPEFIGESQNTALDPVDVLERTLTHGFEFVPGSKSQKIGIALDLVEETFSVKFSRMAEENPLMYLSLTGVLSVHTLIAGIAMGVCTDTSCIIPIAIGVVSHLWVVALALGISLHKSKVSLKIHFLVALFWSSALPVGILSGSLFTLFLSQNILLGLQGFFVSLAAGTFIYVAVVDVILQEFTAQEYKYQKFILLILGFVILGGLLFAFD